MEYWEKLEKNLKEGGGRVEGRKKEKRKKGEEGGH